MLDIDQLCLWVAAYSVHDDDRSLCVPDMSCWLSSLQAPREQREAYLAAYMRQFDEDPRRAKEARLMIDRMNLRFLAARVAGLGAWVTPERGGLQEWVRPRQ